MNLHSPQTISGASQQNSVASIQLLKLLSKMLQHYFVVKIQESFVDYTASPDFPVGIWGGDSRQFLSIFLAVMALLTE